MGPYAYSDTLSLSAVKHVDGQLVDVISGEIYPACVNFNEGTIIRIERKVSAPLRYILPGLIDAHVHIESSLLTPYRFAEKVTAHGTTAVVANPHGIANVMGMAGVRYMVEDGKNAPLRFFYAAPSDVPATGMETSGGAIGWKDVRELLSTGDFVALGDVTDVRGVLKEDPEVMAKLEVATQAGKRIDGRAPGLRGYDLDRYIMAGVSSDHEHLSLGEAEEKHRRGMTIMVREGNTSRDLDALMPFAMNNRHLLVTDNLTAVDLADGHLDALLRRAVAGGMDPVHAVRAVTLWPASHYGLPGGVVRAEGPADLTVVEDLTTFRVLETWIGGELVAKDGVPMFMGNPTVTAPMISPPGVLAKDLRVPSHQAAARVRAIRVLPDQAASVATIAAMEVSDGAVLPDPERDLLLIAVVNRYRPARPAVAFTTGFGLTRGAMASSVSHSSHNLVGVGTDPALLALALNAVAGQGGGYYATDTVDSARLELPVAGLMAARPWDEVARGESEVNAFLRGMGCPLPAPFTTLSYQTLLAVPELKLSDLGLFDTAQGGPGQRGGG